MNLLNCGRQSLLASTLLAMLLFRAYIPAGFMPASGTPFLLELCPASSSMPMPMPAHHHHHAGTHTHFENCPFGSATAAGPISHVIVFEPTGRIASHDVTAFESLPPGVRPQRAHRPRGPPLPRLS